MPLPKKRWFPDYSKKCWFITVHDWLIRLKGYLYFTSYFLSIVDWQLIPNLLLIGNDLQFY